MVKSLFNFLKKPKSGSEVLTELDITRVVGDVPAAQARPIALEKAESGVDLNVWKQKDLDLLQSSWQAQCEAPSDEEVEQAFRSALHNLHGASGAYGGGALTRLTSSLQKLVSAADDLQAEAALINLHVQACRATMVGSEDGAEDIADAVCDALEARVEERVRVAQFAF